MNSMVSIVPSWLQVDHTSSVLNIDSKRQLIDKTIYLTLWLLIYPSEVEFELNVPHLACGSQDVGLGIIGVLPIVQSKLKNWTSTAIHSKCHLCHKCDIWHKYFMF